MVLSFTSVSEIGGATGIVKALPPATAPSTAKAAAVSHTVLIMFQSQSRRPLFPLLSRIDSDRGSEAGFRSWQLSAAQAPMICPLKEAASEYAPSAACEGQFKRHRSTFILACDAGERIQIVHGKYDVHPQNYLFEAVG
jgi:hypothetical protein